MTTIPLIFHARKCLSSLVGPYKVGSCNQLISIIILLLRTLNKNVAEHFVQSLSKRKRYLMSLLPAIYMPQTMLACWQCTVNCQHLV